MALCVLKEKDGCAKSSFSEIKVVLYLKASLKLLLDNLYIKMNYWNTCKIFQINS